MRRVLIVLALCATLPACTGGGVIYENDNGPRGPERVGLPNYGVQYPGFMDGNRCCPAPTEK